MRVGEEKNLTLPAVDWTLAQLAGARLFSKLDANSGFWQISLSALLTNVRDPNGNGRGRVHDG